MMKYMDREKGKNGDRPPLLTVVVAKTMPVRGHRGTRDLARGKPQRLNRLLLMRHKSNERSRPLTGNMMAKMSLQNKTT